MLTSNSMNVFKGFPMTLRRRARENFADFCRWVVVTDHDAPLVLIVFGALFIIFICGMFGSDRFMAGFSKSGLSVFLLIGVGVLFSSSKSEDEARRKSERTALG